ncbi:MAG: type II toxin-antitoxin system Phd/YefM family antitoxin [Pseudomonadota bacterium]|nr:type II toxin-antitoxin system Phd/YefM family antitoxin [Gammaproteobacteria bacterium]MDQ3581581.1 type II toxin-antitoxin system Phd/YefM family antitoxin [Pseudomonadota bacterium]
MTITVSITEYRNRTDEILDAVIEGEETVVVTLADGRNFVLVPGPEWRSMERPPISRRPPPTVPLFCKA